MLNHPAIYTFIASLLLIFLNKSGRNFKFIAICFPIFAGYILSLSSGLVSLNIEGNYFIANFSLENKLIALSFMIVTLTVNIYATGQGRKLEIISGGIYLSFSLISIFSGDLISLFASFELMIIPASILIFISGSPHSSKFTKQYLFTHFFSGGLILIGVSHIIIKLANTEITRITGLINNEALSSFICYLMLLGCLINIAAVPFSNWMLNCYSKASSTGFVYLVTFTTKVSILILFKLFSGLSLLKFFGIAMVLCGGVYACFENNIKRLLCYLTISQLGIILIAISYDAPLVFIVQYLVIDIIYKALISLSFACLSDNKNIENCTQLTRVKPLLLNFSLMSCILVIVNFPFTATFFAKALISNSLQSNNIRYLVSCTPLLMFIALPIKQLLNKNEPTSIDLSKWQRVSLTILLSILIGINIPIIFNYFILPSDNIISSLLTENLIKQTFVTIAGIFILLTPLIPTRKIGPKKFDFDILVSISKLFGYLYSRYQKFKIKDNDKVDDLNILFINDYITKILTPTTQANAISTLLVVLIIILITLIKD